MTMLAVVADDLTGALDASAPFAARGLSTCVALGPDGLDEAIASGAQIIGVSTDSRDLSPEAARQAVALCVAKLPRGVSIFKKVDSRLKGNISAELDALPFSRALVVPAIPAFGRWVRNGRLAGFGVAEPVDVASRLGAHASKSTIPEIATQADIEHAVAAIEHDLPIGARGLAEAIAARLAPGTALAPGLHINGPAICVIGSTDAITVAQVEGLRNAAPTLRFIPAPAGLVTGLGPVRSPLTVLQALPGEQRVEPAVVAARLGDALLQLRPEPGTTLVVSGGATAQVVLRALGIKVLELVGEAQPGLPLARAAGFTIITKSGGFGGPDALINLLGHLAHPIAQSTGRHV